MTRFKKPNVVLIMVDDMGYSDLSCYGGDIETHNLDALAARGVTFTHFCNTARCCPARASLLTGLYPHQVGMGWMTAANLGHKGYVGDLSSNCRTIAECLKTAGYSTYMSGKWHLTFDDYAGPMGPKHSWPCQRGFDRFFGTMQGAGSYFNPSSLTLDNGATSPTEGFYYTDAISDYACTFIAEHTSKTDRPPFFLYTAYTAPHWPLHARAEDIAKYRGRFKAGWDVMRRQKHQRMIDIGLLDPAWKLSPRDDGVPAWDSLAREEQDVFDLRMAIYAAQVDAMDRGVGRIVECLKNHGIFDDTLILFLSDNGGCHEEIHWKSHDPASFGTDDSFESYGRGWANVSNTPFRLFKSWVHEGGIATPLIAHWPNGISARGALDPQPGHITDIMPTCLELAQARYRSDHEHLPDLVGKSLVPSFSGGNNERGCIFWEHEGNRALRKGRWKLVAKGVAGPWELYDMVVDRSEQNNLASKHQDIVNELAGEWERIAARAYVFPLDGRGWDERIKSPVQNSDAEQSLGSDA
jgi:arylsulfatase A-like enzyme